MKRKIIAVGISAVLLAASACNTSDALSGSVTPGLTGEALTGTPTEIPTGTPEKTPTKAPTEVPGKNPAEREETQAAETKPATNEELFEYVISKWKQGKAEELYGYADAGLAAILGRDGFAYLFDSVSDIGGTLNGVTDKKQETANGIATYTAKLDFEHLTADLAISFSNLKIASFNRNVYFKDTFEIDRGSGRMERYFVLENDGYKLNAVYTYVNDGKPHPAVLLIAGSGPGDYNETVGLLTPFEEIALGLAENGINSLRVDKRTLNYASDFGITSGMEQEYGSDCNAAIDFLKKENISGLYLLGHSLGGQIAAELVAGNSDIDGMILFNSSARHLADIACDQYTRLDSANKDTYLAHAAAAKAAARDTAQGAYYYNASDYYWASYNQLDTLKSVKDAEIRTLIINSRFDNQIFDADIELWESHFSDNENVAIRVFDDISHFGYKIDTTDSLSVYRRVDFPEELIRAFSDFVRETP